MALTKIDISLMENTGTTANKLLVYDGSGNLPAVDASQLTNVSTGITESSSDPTISTNPAGGVGTEWCNTTSGEVYICTDATAGANVWTNVGAGTGNVAPFHGEGSQYSYCAGGGYSPSNVIDRFNFSSSVTSTDVGNLYLNGNSPSGTSYGNAGASSTTHGYAFGGYTNTNPYNHVSIDKWTFASATANATDVGDLTVARRYISGCSSTTHGYGAGGYVSGTVDVIDKFPFATDSNASDVGNLTAAHSGGQCNHSSTHGYYFLQGSTAINKFAFASDGNATAYGGTTHATSVLHGAGTCSSTHGYFINDASTSGGTIAKFSFASEGNSTQPGVLSIVRAEGACGTQSGDHGYIAGGHSAISQIDRFSFSSDGNGVDVGDLTVARGGGMAGAQF